MSIGVVYKSRQGRSLRLVVEGPLSVEDLKMRLSTLKFVIRDIIWLVPFISLLIYAIVLNSKNEEDNQVAREEKKMLSEARMRQEAHEKYALAFG